MELTAIEPRRHRMVQLFLDGEPAVKLDAVTAQEERLRVGMELDDEELHALLQKSDAARANEKALYLLEHRPHAKRELERKLSRTVSEDYARRLAQELARKGYAAPRTAQELARRGIDRDLARAAAQEAVSDPGESLRALIARKYARRLGDEKGRRQTVAALQRLGYRWDEIRSALREFDALPEGDTD